ncbi:MAG: holo-ACP synthase [Chitinophagaceae bacterium]|nr:holo-ACP synthase [Chitinophagaceae bacterium]
MIKGIGTDIVETDRIAKAIEKEQGFRELVFSKHEIAYCESRANKYEHYAARFAAKEAFFKAIGTGWKTGTAFNEVEIYHAENGKPELRIHGETENTIGTVQIQVSLSHIKTMAVAVVLVMQ